MHAFLQPFRYLKLRNRGFMLDVKKEGHLVFLWQEKIKGVESCYISACLLKKHSHSRSFFIFFPLIFFYQFKIVLSFLLVYLMLSKCSVHWQLPFDNTTALSVLFIAFHSLLYYYLIPFSPGGGTIWKIHSIKNHVCMCICIIYTLQFQTFFIYLFIFICLFVCWCIYFS